MILHDFAWFWMMKRTHEDINNWVLTILLGSHFNWWFDWLCSSWRWNRYYWLLYQQFWHVAEHKEWLSRVLYCDWSKLRFNAKGCIGIPSIILRRYPKGNDHILSFIIITIIIKLFFLKLSWLYYHLNHFIHSFL